MPGRGVLFDIDGPVGGLVPDGRLVVPVHDVQLHLHLGVQQGGAAVARAHMEFEFCPLKQQHVNMEKGGDRYPLDIRYMTI
jgi:hypothetical protein